DLRRRRRGLLECHVHLPSRGGAEGQGQECIGAGRAGDLERDRDEVWSARRRGCDERCIGQTFCSGESQLLGRLQCRWRKAFGRFVPETAPPPAILRLKRKWRNSKGEINRLV